MTAYGILLLAPLALGTGLLTRADGSSVGSRGDFGFAPLTPVRMLFTLHRGLFVWTPATALAVAGFVLLIRRHHGVERTFLVTLGAMVVALLLMNVSLTWWDGGWSFSMRYLASPLALYAIGLGGLLASAGRRLRLLVAVIAVTVAWSLFLGMNHAFGVSQRDGANDIVALYVHGQRTPGDFVRTAWNYSRVRHLVP